MARVKVSPNSPPGQLAAGIALPVRAAGRTGQMGWGALLVRLFALAATSAALLFVVPHVVRLTCLVYAYSLSFGLPELTSNDALKVLEELDQLGPAGAVGLIRGLEHPEDEVADVALRMLWRRVAEGPHAASATAEATSAVAALVRGWPRVPPHRQRAAASVLARFLSPEQNETARQKRLKQQALACLQSVGLMEDPAFLQILQGRALPRPLASDARRTLATTETLATSPSQQDRTPQSPAASPEQTSDPGTQWAIHEVPLAPAEGEAAGTSSPAPAVVLRFEEVTPPAQDTSPDGAVQSFGPGQLPAALKLQEEPPDPLPHEANTPGESQPGQPPQPTEENMAPAATPLSAASAAGPGLPHTGETTATLLTANPWLRDKELLVQLSANEALAKAARETLRQKGWDAASLELGRLAFHPQPDFRRRALQRMWDVSQVLPVPFLEALLNDPDPALRREIVIILGTMNSATARTLLARMASSDPDPDIRSLASEVMNHRLAGRETASGR